MPDYIDEDVDTISDLNLVDMTQNVYYYVTFLLVLPCVC